MALSRLISTTAPLWQRLVALWPAAAVVATLGWIGIRGTGHPLSLLIAAAWLTAGFRLVLLTAPAALYVLFPLSMLWFLGVVVEPFDLALLLLAGVSVLPHVSRLRWNEIRLHRIEWTYGLFLACLLTTLATPFEARRLLAVTKTYALGWLAYEVARRAAHRYGRRSLVWGLALLAGVTVLMLILRQAASGVGATQVIKHRTLLTNLSWGSSNYVAAVLVALMPAALYLMQSRDGGLVSRRFGALAFVVTIAGALLSTSRGGVLLAIVTALAAARGTWRTRWRPVAAAAAVVGLVVLMPVGAAVMKRFQDPQEMYSILARWEVWKSTWERGVTHLPFGIGHGQGRIQGDELGDIDPHNFPLTLFSEGGPLALIVWLMLLHALWLRGAALARTRGGEQAGRSLRLLVMLAFLNSLFEPTFSGHLYYVLFWWSAGVLDADQPEAAPEVGFSGAEARGERNLISEG